MTRKRVVLALSLFTLLALGLTGAIAAAPERLGSQDRVTAARCGKCGDGQCVRQCGETPESCPVDCGTPASE